MRILAVCGMGLGSGLLLRMQAEKALARLGVSADVEVADVNSARAMKNSFDLIVTSDDLVAQIGDTKVPVVTISNFVNLEEMVTKLSEALG
jgi:PTS system ascorbate-specific IIB component